MRGFEPEAGARILLHHGYELKRVDENGRLQGANVADIPDVVLENWVAVRP
jgi:hypothetical protein